MNIVYRSPAELIPYRKNAKEHDKKQISNVAKSIKKYGFQQPIVVDKNMVIIVGHCRHLAALKLGLEEVPVVVADNLTDEQVKEFRLVDNKSNESDWIMEFLQEEIPLLPGLEDFEFDWKLPQVEELDAVEDDYEGELPDVPKSKLGDIYQLGRHRLMCGSSTDPAQVEALMDGRQADMLLTDPPYNVDYHGGNHGSHDEHAKGMTIQNDNMSEDAFIDFLSDAFESADAVMKPGAVFYIWHADRQCYAFHLACKKTGFQVRETLIWLKQQLILGRNDYHYKHEPCIYGWKEGANHLWASDRKQTTVLEFDRPRVNDIHPTMKPVKLFDYQMKNNTKGGDIVLDLFGGSGTTIIAAEQNGRCGYCMELDPKYVDAILDRYISYKGSADDVFLLRDGVKIPYSEI